MHRPPALSLDLPQGWVGYRVKGFHLVAAGPGDAVSSPRLIAATYGGQPADVEQLDRMYLVEDTAAEVAGLPARRVDLTRWNGDAAVFTRRWLVQYALPSGRATLEISAHCLVGDYQRYTHVFDAAVAGARLMPARPLSAPVQTVGARTAA
ncbi:hypothetical protein [Micrococcus terreus]|uniref:Uncharacterized protein n=1 Tax=Micrococcus terreus TaxID=574650 RepID=A0A1I7ME58_9MICC|nr:hypothetical protein [Micrococcus terreus]SFV20199.1 hypothetical protein SAMN04487966_101216 [Micrococcus terreus]